MASTLTAEDLKPLVEKLPREEQVRLARMALGAAAATGGDAIAYSAATPSGDEFPNEPDGLEWESDGWSQPLQRK
jgi:hypothetical protein